MKNKKGFTLVELLAVIVVLAILILIAITAVLPQIEKSRKNAFFDEALIYKREAEKAYIAESIDGTSVTCFAVNADGQASGFNNDYVLNDNYVKKSGASSYTGKIVFDANGNITTFNLSNGKYQIKNTSITKGNVQKVGDSGVTWTATTDAKC